MADASELHIDYLSLGQHEAQDHATLDLLNEVARSAFATSVSLDQLKRGVAPENSRFLVVSRRSPNNEPESKSRRDSQLEHHVLYGELVMGILILNFFGGQLVETELRVGADTLERAIGWRGFRDHAKAFLRAVVEDRTPPSVNETLLGLAVERLLRHVQHLLDDKVKLEAALAAALDDRDVARARIAELELQAQSLHHEQYETKEQGNKTLKVLKATAIATILGPLAAVALDHHLDEHVAGAQQTVVEIQQQCPEVDVNVTVQLPGDPAQPLVPGPNTFPGTTYPSGNQYNYSEDP